jgi:C-terminal processing protease CtpA/Prc
MKRILGIVIIITLINVCINAQNYKLTDEEKEQIIENIIAELNDGYIFPETAHRIEKYIRENQHNQIYNYISNPTEFASILTKHLSYISNDKHLFVDFYKDIISDGKGDYFKMTTEELELKNRKDISENFGFNKIKILKGNIGYIELKRFINTGNAPKFAASAFDFVADTKALIIDIRNNEGGSPYMVQLLCSYLLEESQVHLNSIYWRKRQTTDEFYTLNHLEGKRYLNKDVFILTSEKTFSAAEEFAYNLQALKRAIIVGEATAGGAHPGDFVKLTDHFGMFLPGRQSVNPITKTNWEGSGVIPDISCPEKDALKTSRKIINKK